MSFTASEAKGEWIFVNTIDSRSYTATVGYTTAMKA
jgi:hypothetical protein